MYRDSIRILEVMLVLPRLVCCSLLQLLMLPSLASSWLLAACWSMQPRSWPNRNRRCVTRDGSRP